MKIRGYQTADRKLNPKVLRKRRRLAQCLLAALFLMLSAAGWRMNKEEGIMLNSVMEAAMEEDDQKSQADLQIRKVALTYDDGPDSRYSRELLEVLRKEKVTATFFLLGEKIEGREEIVRQMYEEGHIIGNHTFSHTDLEDLSARDAMRQLTDTNEAIRNCTGEYPQFFRPPFGNIRRETDRQIPMVLVSWNIDPRDWECQNTSVIVERVMNNLRDNGIILLHDGYEPTVEATRLLIPLLREEGYTIVSVEELLFP